MFNAHPVGQRGQAIEDEVADYINAHADKLDGSGRRLVVRNGHKPERTILTGVSPLWVRQPRVDDRRTDKNGVRFQFTSEILPRYLRNTTEIAELVPWLYLKGISTGEMPDALVHLGFDGTGLSPMSVTRMTETWQGEYEAWNRRDLTGKRYVYVWADGIYFGCRLTDERPCVPVLMGATADGTKERIALVDGQRESEAGWTELLLGLKDRGLVEPPQLATGDGGLGFWKALSKVFTIAYLVRWSRRHVTVTRQTTTGGLISVARFRQKRERDGLTPICWYA